MKSSRFSLEGRTAVLTGAGGFFGRYFASALLEHGAKVILIDLSAETLKFFYQEYKDRYELFFVDLYDRKAVRECYERILSQNHLGIDRVDVLINNAFDFGKRTGFNARDGKLENASFEQLRASFESGVYWSIQATQFFGQKMKRHGWGSIINICSIHAIVVPEPDLFEGTDRFNPPGYSMAKAGLLQFTKYAASFLSPEVRVNAISPGIIPNLEGRGRNSLTADDPVLRKLSNKTLLKRLGHPRDLTGALIYLASDASGYVTGQNIVIDGGFTIT